MGNHANLTLAVPTLFAETHTLNVHIPPQTRNQNSERSKIVFSLTVIIIHTPTFVMVKL